jgi:hypothetical protein
VFKAGASVRVVSAARAAKVALVAKAVNERVATTADKTTALSSSISSFVCKLQYIVTVVVSKSNNSQRTNSISIPSINYFVNVILHFIWYQHWYQT